MNILVVDDSRAMRMIVRRTLRQAGVDATQISEAENGQDALEQIEASRPDLVLCDWNMPVMSGIELLETLGRKNLRMPFGFVTSQSTPAMKQRARQAGAWFVIAKPFTAQSFADALRVLKAS